jgi:hypothetical protein
MPKMTDQEFDNLFRHAANRISPEHMPGDWENMQRRLEVAERDARARNISLYAMVALLLLYSFLMPDHLKSGRYNHASFVPELEQSGSQTTASGETSASDAKQKSEGLSAQSAGKESQVKADIGSTVASSSELKERDRESEGSSAGLVKSEKSEVGNAHAEALKQQGNRLLKSEQSSNAAASISKDQSEDVIREQGRSKAGGVESTSGTEGVDRTTAGVVNAGDATSGVIADVTDNVGVRSGQSSSGGIIEPDPLEAPSTDPLSASPDGPARVQLSVAGRVTVAPANFRHPWFVKMAVSPDFSSIDYGSAGKTGINLGPMVEYGISPRFSISTGAIWSKKLYDQENPEKTYGQGSGYPVKANMLNGDCRIIDVPLNVTYYMLPGRRTNLFVTVGSSSYIMLDEEYIYTVTRNNHNYEYVETYANENNEWFSMLNLSVGVQHQITKRCFIQGEPFIKAPMKGVGEGKVNLVSAGVFVSVKYWINP